MNAEKDKTMLPGAKIQHTVFTNSITYFKMMFVSLHKYN